MSIRYRLMQPEDVPGCAAIIARHPVLRRRYGETIQYLSPVWCGLLQSEGCISSIFEDDLEGRNIVLGGAINIFVTDEFANELKTPPHFWIGPEIVRRVRAGRSPMLNPRQVREANSRTGLIAVAWHTGLLPENLAHPEFGNTVHRAFNELHRGYLLKEVLVQADCQSHLDALRAIGVQLWNGSQRRYEWIDALPICDLLEQTHVLGLSRQLAVNLSGYWAATTFFYQPPRFGFTSGEQRLISCGLLGGTDNEIADELGISLDVVRKTWRTVYDRVAAVAPGLLPNSSSQASGRAERGRAKKQRVLAYVSTHPEELRPISRRLLDSSSARPLSNRNPATAIHRGP